MRSHEYLLCCLHVCRLWAGTRCHLSSGDMPFVVAPLLRPGPIVRPVQREELTSNCDR